MSLSYLRPPFVSSVLSMSPSSRPRIVSHHSAACPNSVRRRPSLRFTMIEIQPAFIASTLSIHPLQTCFHSCSTASVHRVPLPASRFMGARLSITHTPHLHDRSSDSLPHTQFRRHITTCYAENNNNRNDGDDDDDDDDFDFQDDRELQLWDTAAERFLTVNVEEEIDYKDTHYLLCYPDDDAVAFARMLESGQLEIIDNKDTIAKLFPNASAVMSEDQMTLHDTPYVLTMTDLRYLEEEQSDFSGHNLADRSNRTDEYDDIDNDDDGDDDDDDELDDDENVEVLAEFDFEGNRYYVIRPLGPVHIVAKAVGTNVVVVDDNELEQITPVIEEFIMDRDSDSDDSIE